MFAKDKLSKSGSFLVLLKNFFGSSRMKYLVGWLSIRQSEEIAQFSIDNAIFKSRSFF